VILSNRNEDRSARRRGRHHGVGVPDGSALPEMYKPQRGRADKLAGYVAAMEGIREMMVPTVLEPGAVRPRLAIAEVVERLSAAVPGGVSCFTLNIDGLWPEACAVHGTIQEDNVVLTGTVPAKFEEERKRRYEMLATALDEADMILICGMSGRTLSINDVLLDQNVRGSVSRYANESPKGKPFPLFEHAGFPSPGHPKTCSSAASSVAHFVALLHTPLAESAEASKT
jgi:hypothetical protein